MKRLPPDLRADALRRLRHAARRPRPPAIADPRERAHALLDWVRAARLDKYGFKVGLDPDQRIFAKIGRRVYLLDPC